MFEMSAAVIANGYAVGAASLAAWVLVRYPRVGARTLPGALTTSACAYVLLLFTGRATATAQSAAGPAVALLTVFLPMLTFAFWAGFRLIRLTVSRH